MQEEKILTVGDTMTKGVICVDVEDTVQEAAEVMSKNDISSVLVTHEGKGVGIITERDVIIKIVAENKDPKNIEVESIMNTPLITIEANASIDDAARIMRDKDIRRLVVTDKDSIIGILSEFDIVRIEPALHTLISERYAWDIQSAHAAEQGTIAGVCEACENYSERLRPLDGMMLCEDCTQ